MSLPIDGRVVHDIATLLAHLDEDGTTRTAGVTRLEAAGPVSPTLAAPRTTRDEASTTA